MLKLSEEPAARLHLSRQPGVYPCSLVGGRIGTSGWSLIGGRYGHTRDLVRSASSLCSRPGRSSASATAAGRRCGSRPPGISSSTSSWVIRTLGIATEATLELVKRPEAEFSAFYAYPSYLDAWRATGEFAAAARRRSPASSSSTSGSSRTSAATTRRTSCSQRASRPPWQAMYGNEDEVLGEADHANRQGVGGRYLGDEISQGDWASRHDRYATPSTEERPTGRWRS